MRNKECQDIDDGPEQGLLDGENESEPENNAAGGAEQNESSHTEEICDSRDGEEVDPPTVAIRNTDSDTEQEQLTQTEQICDCEQGNEEAEESNSDESQRDMVQPRSKAIDIEEEIPQKHVGFKDFEEIIGQGDLLQEDQANSRNRDLLDEGAKPGSYSDLIRDKFHNEDAQSSRGTSFRIPFDPERDNGVCNVQKSEGYQDPPDFTSPPNNSDSFVTRREVDRGVPYNDTTPEDERRPGAYPVQGRAPGALPTWGRRLRRALTRSQTHSSRGPWTSASVLEATRVTDAHLVVVAASVEKEEIDELSRARRYKRRSRIVIFVFVLVILLLVALILGLVLHNHKTNDNKAIDAMSDFEECLKRTSVASNIYTLNNCRDDPKCNAWIEEEFVNTTQAEDTLCSPQNIALMWLVEEILNTEPNETCAGFNGRDLMAGMAKNETDANSNFTTCLNERYIMATFYFALSGNNWTIGADHKWLSQEHVCGWEGIRCRKVDEGWGVAAIYLPNSALDGTIPKEFFRLKHLKVLNLPTNHIERIDIDTSSFDVTDLRMLDLNDNFLGGTIPPQIGHLKKLNVLNLNGNKIHGSLPVELGNLEKLKYFDAGQNLLSGSIPTVIGGLKYLRLLQLYDNHLSGTIPSELGNITNLEILSLGGGNHNGTIPTELGSLENLEVLVIAEGNVTGPIPSALGGLDLWMLSLHGNELNGTVPSQLGNMPDLVFLDLGKNKIPGTIPSELGKLENLEVLDLRKNSISGNIPKEVCNSIFLTQLCVDKTVEKEFCSVLPCIFQGEEWRHYFPLSADF